MNMTSSSGLFVTGDIYLIRKPIPGNYGIHKLFDMLVSSQFGIVYDLNTMPEIWLLTTNKRKKRLSILHVECFGYENIVRFLHGNNLFNILFDEKAPPITLTRSQLRRLVLDGTVEGTWNNACIQENATTLIPENLN